MLMQIIALTVCAPQIQAHGVADDTVVVDGVAAEAAWRYGTAGSGFTEQSPVAGRRALEQSRVRVLVSGEHLFVLAELSGEQPEARLSRRDEDGPGPWVHFDFDSFGDKSSGYRFSINPANVQRDARVRKGSEDRGYNAVWRSATTTSSSGWTVECAIPLAEIRYRGDGGTWGFQVTREHIDGSVSRWSPTPQSAAEPVLYYGALEGVAPAPRRRPFIVRPVAVARMTASDGQANLSASAGVDAKLGLGDGFSVDLTVLPDFGQVEADPSQLNLGASELFLEERRPFFAASSEYLGFGLGFGDGSIGNSNLFYSRRLGSTPIAGAAQLSGKSNGWTVGMFDAVSLAEGDRPATQAAAVRVGRALMDGKLTLSTSATHLHRFVDDETDLVSDALTGGVSAEGIFDGWLAQARVFGSHVTGTQEAITAVQESPVHFFQRPDAEHVDLKSRNGLSGYGITALLAQLEHPTVRGAVGGFAYSPGLEVNDLGFLPRADQQLAFGWLQFRKDGGFARSVGINFNVSGGRSFGSEFLGFNGNSNVWWTSQGQHTLGAGVSYESSGLSPTALFGGPALYTAPRTSGWLEYSSNQNRPLRAEAQVSGGRTTEGGYNVRAKTKVSFRPRPSLELSLQPEFSHARSTQTYVGEDSGYLVAQLDRTVAQVQLRGDWTVTPDLSVQVYAAPYLSAGRFSRGRRVTSSRDAEQADRFAAYGGAEVPDAITFDQVRANAVVRWVYSPGSALTLAWSHEQTFDDDADTRLQGADIGRLLQSPSEDRVVLKLSHRLAI